MRDLVRNCITYRELLFSLSESYVKARYKQTILGTAWAVIPPLLLMVTAIFLIPHLSTITPDMQPYPLFVYIGFWMWTFFSNGLSFAIPNLAQNTPLLRKVYFPREILVLAALVPSLLDFLLGIPVLIILLIYYHISLHIGILLVPFIFLVELMLVCGIALAGAITNVAFRDVSKFLPILLQILLFATPVIYATEAMNKALQPYIALNPLTGIFNAVRYLLMPEYIFHWKELGISAIVSGIVLYAGCTVFRAGENVIVDIA